MRIGCRQKCFDRRPLVLGHSHPLLIAAPDQHERFGAFVSRPTVPFKGCCLVLGDSCAALETHRIGDHCVHKSALRRLPVQLGSTSLVLCSSKAVLVAYAKQMNSFYVVKLRAFDQPIGSFLRISLDADALEQHLGKLVLTPGIIEERCFLEDVCRLLVVSRKRHVISFPGIITRLMPILEHCSQLYLGLMVTCVGAFLEPESSTFDAEALVAPSEEVFLCIVLDSENLKFEGVHRSQHFFFLCCGCSAAVETCL